jgi:hypothetical protein
MGERPEWAILRYPRFVTRLLPRATAVSRALYPFIVLTPELYERVITFKESDADAWAVVIHERAHIERVKNTTPLFGPVIFGIRFLLADKDFMLKEELHAIKEEMKFRASSSISYDIERKARQFASPLYRNLMTEHAARRLLTDLWETVVQEYASVRA